MNGPQTRSDELTELVTQMRELGATDEQIAARTAHLKPDEHFEVYAGNWGAVSWLTDIPNLLAFLPNGRCKGLDVLAVQADAQMSERDIVPDDYEKLRHLGTCIAKEINNRQSSQ